VRQATPNSTYQSINQFISPTVQQQHKNEYQQNKDGLGYQKSKSLIWAGCPKGAPKRKIAFSV